jgi:hypothetical protein
LRPSQAGVRGEWRVGVFVGVQEDKAAICNEASTALDAFTTAVAKINIGNNGTAAWEARAKA